MNYELIITYNFESIPELGITETFTQKFKDYPCVDRCGETKTLTITGDGYFYLIQIRDVKTIIIQPLAVQGD